MEVKNVNTINFKISSAYNNNYPSSSIFINTVHTIRLDSTIEITSKLAESFLQTVSTRSVRQAPKRIGYSSCTATHKPFISKVNKVRRTTFARDMLIALLCFVIMVGYMFGDSAMKNPVQIALY